MGTFMEYFNAFWVGGLICALCQILLDRTKMLPGRIMVTLVCTGAVLSFLGLYDPFAEHAGAGASVPLLGFGHLLFQGVKDAVKESGFLGCSRADKGGGCRNISGVDFRVSCKLDFPAEDEKIAGEKLRRSRRTDIIKKNAAEKSRIAAAGRIQKKAGVLRKKHQNTRDRKKGSLQ